MPRGEKTRMRLEIDGEEVERTLPVPLADQRKEIEAEIRQIAMDPEVILQLERIAALYDLESRAGITPAFITPKARVQAAILVAQGNHLDVAAAAQGIGKQTLLSWLSRGAKVRDTIEAGDCNLMSLMPTEAAACLFACLMERAVAVFEARQVGNVAAHAEKRWEAAAWLLERRSPKRWSKKTQQQVTGADGGPVRMTFEQAAARVFNGSSDDEKPGETIDIESLAIAVREGNDE